MTDSTDIPQSTFGDKKAVRKTYDNTTGCYGTHNVMQHRNLEVLAGKIFSVKSIFTDVLDIGAGSGFTLANLDSYASKYPFASLVRTDLSDKALLDAPEVLCCPNIKVQCDAENLPFGNNHFDLVYANSVLHWLTAESGITGFRKGIAEALRVTKPNGLFAASIAAVGTSQMFFKAYKSVLGSWKKKLSLKLKVQPNPIGAMDLHTVVRVLLVCGADVISAELVYEPVIYSSAKEYIDDVKAYGYYFLLNGVDANLQSILWNDISECFMQNVGSDRYVHDQYMIYVLALAT